MDFYLAEPDNYDRPPPVNTLHHDIFVSKDTERIKTFLLQSPFPNSLLTGTVLQKEYFPITYYSSENMPDLVRLCVKFGSPLDLVDQAGHTALIRAARKANLDMVKLLVDLGANVNHIIPNSPSTLLGNIIGYESFSNIAFPPLNKSLLNYALFEAKVDVNESGGTGIQECIIIPRLFPILSTLIDCGLDINKQCFHLKYSVVFSNGLTTDKDYPLFIAVHHRRLPSIQLLVAHGANINCIDPENHKTPLFEACVQRDLEIIQFLLEKGADPNIPNKEGFSPLSKLCCSMNTLPYIEALFQFSKHRVDLNQVNKYKMTALMNAVISGNLPILCLLLINGADDQILKEGKTVHDLSTDKEISAILELFRTDKQSFEKEAKEIIQLARSQCDPTPLPHSTMKTKNSNCIIS